jgi:hypothetical protein
MNIFQRSLALLLSWSLVIGTVPGGAAYATHSVQSEAQPANTGTTHGRSSFGGGGFHVGGRR